MTATALSGSDIDSAGAGDERYLRVSVVPSPVRSQLLANLRIAILSGALYPGQHLVERELMELTDVGRGTIREALRQLAAEGLVTTTPNLGSIVASQTLEQVERIYEVRIEVESLLARLFVLRADSVDRDALVDALRAVERAAARRQPIVEQNIAFHEVLDAGADNEPLRALATSMRARVQFFRGLSFIKPYHSERSIAGLQAIVRAVVSDDADAAAEASAAHTKVECAAVLIALAMWPGPKAGPKLSTNGADGRAAKSVRKPAQRKPRTPVSRSAAANDPHEPPMTGRGRPHRRVDRVISLAE